MRISRAFMAAAAPRSQSSKAAPLIRISKGTFYRQQPSSSNIENVQNGKAALFPSLDFTVESHSSRQKHWAIIGPSDAGKTTLLEIFRGQLLCFPPSARRYPYLSSEELLQKSPLLSYPQRAIQYVGFSSKDRGLSGMGTYLSARYESRKEVTDFTLRDYLIGNTQLNPSVEDSERIRGIALDNVTVDLRLQALLDMPVSHLSNGQTRRARIAKALLSDPELLLLDEPFSGLDPRMTLELSPLLKRMAESQSPRILLTLRPQDPIPYWITHVAYLGKDLRITHAGAKDKVCQQVRDEFLGLTAGGQAMDRLPRYNEEFGRVLTEEGILDSPYLLPTKAKQSLLRYLKQYEEGDRSEALVKKIHGKADSALDSVPEGSQSVLTKHFRARKTPKGGEPVIEMDGVNLKYEDRHVIGAGGTVGADGTKQDQGLWWNVRRGEKWGIFGANGSGKTTILSLITSDHPQAYSAPLKIFGRSRLPSKGQRGVSLFDLQANIGHSSPEVHSYFPRHLTVREAIESAYADTPLSRPRLDILADERVDALLRWFQGEIDPRLGMYPRLRWEIFRDTFPEGIEDGSPYSHRQELRSAPRGLLYAGNLKAATFEEEMSRIDSTDWAYETRFGDLSFSGQRVVLFLRAIVSSPAIVVLDEAFGGMDDAVRDKCLLFLEFGETRLFAPTNIPTEERRAASAVSGRGIRNISMPKIEKRVGLTWQRDPILFTEGIRDDQALIVVSHVREEIPISVKQYLYLPEIGSGMPYQIGEIKSQPIKFDSTQWSLIWGMNSANIAAPQDE